MQLRRRPTAPRELDLGRGGGRDGARALGALPPPGHPLGVTWRVARDARRRGLPRPAGARAGGARRLGRRRRRLPWCWAARSRMRSVAARRRHRHRRRATAQWRGSGPGRSGRGALDRRPRPGGRSLWADDVGRASHLAGRGLGGRAGELGVAGEVHKGPLVRTRGPRVCFAGLGPGEVTVGGRKVVGTPSAAPARPLASSARPSTAGIPQAIVPPARPSPVVRRGRLGRRRRGRRRRPRRAARRPAPPPAVGRSRRRRLRGIAAGEVCTHAPRRSRRGHGSPEACSGAPT